MNKDNQPLVLAKGPSTLARAKFGPGMLLQHDDLEQLNVYTRDLNRLMFSSLFGAGVVCGLVVSAKAQCTNVTVTVECGLALDFQGDPIHVPQAQSLAFDEGCDPNMQPSLWVVLCGTRKCCAPRTSMCASDEDESVSACTRERDCFEIRIVRARPGCTCGCPEPDANAPALLDSECRCADPAHQCYQDHYAGKCSCDCKDCALCGCDCVLLARLDRSGDTEHPVWTPDHRVRRFVRPVLMRDPQVWLEQEALKKQKQGATDERMGTPAAIKQQPKSVRKPKS
jgi:hypothetical protein